MGAVSIETAFYVLEAVTALTLVAIAFYIWRQSRKTRHQRHVRKVVESLGLKYLREVVLPDGIDGLVFIDYLLLVPNGFVVLDVNYNEGHLFGGESVDQWSQVINNKTYKFANPLYDNQHKCQAVLWNLQHNLKDVDSQVASTWETQGWVTFSNAGNFPKGIPAQVTMIDELGNNLGLPAEKTASTPPAVDENLHHAWDALHNLSVNTRAEVAR